MRRYWISSENLTAGQAHITGDLLHHIRDVCRIEVGHKFELIKGDHKAYLVEMKSIGKKEAWAEVIETREIPPLPKPWIRLAVSIPRFQTFETILEKAVELGVYDVTPFVSEYSFVRKLGGPLTEKRPRWEKIIRGATEQSGRGEVMNLAEAANLKDLLKIFNPQTNAAGLFPYEGGGDLTIKQALQSLSQKPQVEEIWVFVGSEGGFSRHEVDLFRSHGLKPITLGSQVLRVETACLALVSVIKYNFDLMQ